MNENIATKGFIGLVAGVFSYLAGCMSEIAIILALLVIMDYILGIAAVFMKEKQFDSALALKGAFKKGALCLCNRTGLRVRAKGSENLDPFIIQLLTR